MIVKICGVTSVDDAVFCARAGADMIGLNIWPESPRSVTLEKAASIASVVRRESAGLKIVVVDVSSTVQSLRMVGDRVAPDFLQIHGAYDGFDSVSVGALVIPVIRAFSIGSESDLEVVRGWAKEPFLIDAKVPGKHGGTGEQVPLGLITAVRGRYLLAGGLTPSNVREIAEKVRPWGVDTASGVESSPGVKDHAAVRKFIEAARAAKR